MCGLEYRGDDTAYIPYDPLNILKECAPDLWIADGAEITMRYMGTHLPFPTRMTIIRIADGGLVIHSPVSPNENLFRQVEALGPVKALIAPNTLHYWYIDVWAQRFTDAVICVCPGVEKRAKKPLPDFTILDPQKSPSLWGGVLEQVYVPGSILSEMVFFHVPSSTLILTDLIENFEPERVRSPFLRFLMKVFGAAAPDGKAPFDMQMSFLFHRKAVRAAVHQMLAWQPERILIAHGKSFSENAVDELKRAFRWVL